MSNPKIIITAPMQHIFNPYEDEVSGLVRYPDSDNIRFRALVKIIEPSLSAGCETVEVRAVFLYWGAVENDDQFILWEYSDDYHWAPQAEVLLSTSQVEHLKQVIAEQVNDTITSALEAAHRAFREEQTA